MSDEIVPVQVKVMNWPSPDKTRYNKTTVKTYIFDPAGTGGIPKTQVIAGYEPTRTRLVIRAIDADVMLTTAAPVTVPGTSSTTVQAEGMHISGGINVPPTILFGQDEFYITALSAVSRVTVIKEYLC